MVRYNKKNIKMIDTNHPIIKKLFAVSDSGEGNLIHQPNNEESMITQIKFLEKICDTFKPQYIVETGTNKGFFSYVMLSVLNKYKKSVTIETFDLASWSADAIHILNNYFTDHKVIFHLCGFGGSAEKLKYFNPTNNIDLFFIDGDHGYSGCSEDIKHAIRLNSSLILIDNTNIPEVRQSITDHLLLKYKLLDSTPKYHTFPSLKGTDFNGYELYTKI